MTDTKDFFWQVVDTDREGSFSEGHGEHALLKAICDIAIHEDRETPDGLISSGNIAVYWSRKNVTASVGTP